MHLNTIIKESAQAMKSKILKQKIFSDKSILLLKLARLSTKIRNPKTGSTSNKNLCLLLPKTYLHHLRTIMNQPTRIMLKATHTTPLVETIAPSMFSQYYYTVSIYDKTTAPSCALHAYSYRLIHRPWLLTTQKFHLFFRKETLSRIKGYCAA